MYTLFHKEPSYLQQKYNIREQTQMFYRKKMGRQAGNCEKGGCKWLLGLIRNTLPQGTLPLHTDSRKPGNYQPNPNNHFSVICRKTKL